MFFLICTLISNILDKQDVYMAEQVAEIQAISEQQYTEAKEPDVGGVTTIGMNPLSVVDAIVKMFKREYSFLYDVNYTMSQAECTTYAASHQGARWNSSISACQQPNFWWTVWLIFIWAPTAIVGLYFAMLIVNFIRGTS